MYLLGAFSLNMVADFPATVTIQEASPRHAIAQLRSEGKQLESAVGHASTAAIFQSVLGIPVKMNRVTVSLARGELALVGQYRGPRLEEGATELPDGATISWYWVVVE